MAEEMTEYDRAILDQETKKIVEEIEEKYGIRCPTWYPVEEKPDLPINGLALVYSEYGHILLGHWAGDCWRSGAVSRITHWMYLPEPPFKPTFVEVPE